MKIVLGSDHAGFALKEKVKAHLKTLSVEVEDLGTHSEDAVDYPDYAEKVCQDILGNKNHRGLLVCGTGLGMSYAANRHKGIRAALCTTPEMAQMAADHNNANVLVLGGRVTTEKDAAEIINTWLKTEFSGGRHQRRIDKLDHLGE